MSEFRHLGDSSDSPRFRSPASTPAPITDKMDVEELRRGHAEIRSRRMSRNTIAAAAAVIVASGLLGIGFAELRRHSPYFRSSRAAATPAPVAPPVSNAPEPQRIVDGRLSVDTAPAKPKLAVEAPHTAPQVEEPDIQITPVPRPVIRARTPPAPRIASLSPERKTSPKRLRVSKVVKRTAPPAAAPPKRTTVAAHATKPQPKVTRKPILVARVTPRAAARPAAKIATPIQRAPAPQAPRDLEYHPAERLPHSGPETASFTPMRKERVIPEARRPQPATIPSDILDQPRREPRPTGRNFDDEADREDPGGFARDDSRENRRGRRISHEPTGKRRICVDTGWLAGDLCPRTAIVMAPESRLPTRRCRVHVLP